MMIYAFVMSPLNHFFYTRFLTRLAPISEKPSGLELARKVLTDYTVYGST